MKKIKSTNNKINNLTPLGWREWVYLPLYDNFKIKAKIDTGARSSAIQATNIEVYKKRRVNWIKFEIFQSNNRLFMDTKLVCYKKIKNSFGDTEIRPVIRLKIQIGDEIWNTDISLAKRNGLTYPMLIGRSTLNKKHIIHSHRSYLAGKQLRLIK
tara:strand:+ start:3011 stop:3475 length:465 start_codon:yes stop_codon:yes gene_type:complete